MHALSLCFACFSAVVFFCSPINVENSYTQLFPFSTKLCDSHVVRYVYHISTNNLDMLFLFCTSRITAPVIIAMLLEIICWLAMETNM